MLGCIMTAAQHPGQHRPAQISRTGRFTTAVTATATLTPQMRRITLAGPGIGEQHWPLASDIAIVLHGPDGRELRRRYTVRSSCGDALVVDALLHGHGPGSAWAGSVRAGDQVDFFGPRGSIEIAEADWLLAVTDESGLPAIAALAEAAAASGRRVDVLAEIAGSDGGAGSAEQYPLPDNATARWLARGGEPAGRPDVLRAGIAGFDPPAGAGYAYVLGESRAVVALREALSELGLGRDRVYAKGYWNLNSRGRQ